MDARISLALITTFDEAVTADDAERNSRGQARERYIGGHAAAVRDVGFVFVR